MEPPRYLPGDVIVYRDRAGRQQVGEVFDTERLWHSRADRNAYFDTYRVTHPTYKARTINLGNADIYGTYERDAAHQALADLNEELDDD